MLMVINKKTIATTCHDKNRAKAKEGSRRKRDH